MAGTAPNAVLRRKASAGRRQAEARAPSPARALRLALARAAERRLGLDLVVTATAQQRLDSEDLVAALGDDTLLILVEGPGGASGVLTLDGQAISALIEQQTMGRVTGTPPEDRAFTATDAAMAQPLVDGVFQRAAEELSGGAGAGWVAGLRFGAWLPDLRTLARALQAPEYRLFRFTLDLGGGAREGRLALALAPPAPPPKPARDRTDPPRLADAALRAPVELRAVLYRLQMPLARAGRLAAGQRLAIPASALGGAELVAPDGRVLCKVRLGRVEDMRAVRLPGPPEGLPMPAEEEDAPPPEAPDMPAAAPGPDADDGSAPPPDGEAPPPEGETAAPEDAADPLPDLPPLDFEPMASDVPPGGGEELPEAREDDGV